MKFLLSNLGRGFLYTIGRILAIAFIILVIATLLSKIEPKKIDNFPLTKEVFK